MSAPKVYTPTDVSVTVDGVAFDPAPRHWAVWEEDRVFCSAEHLAKARDWRSKMLSEGQ